MVKKIRVNTYRDSQTGKIIAKSFYDADSGRLLRKEDYEKKQVVNQHQQLVAAVKPVQKKYGVRYSDGTGVPEMPTVVEGGLSAPPPRQTKRLVNQEKQRDRGVPDMPEMKWTESGEPCFKNLK